MEQILHIESLAYGGAGVARLEDGRTVFVDGAAPGDTLRARIGKERRSFAEAELLEVLEPGQARVSPACPYAGVCGGCPWMHVSYDEQLKAKRAGVVAALSHIARWDEGAAEAVVGECAASERQTGYRNKIELNCENDGTGRLVLGFMRKDGGGLLAPDRCLLAHKDVQKAPKLLAGALRYLQGAGGGARGGQDLGLVRVGVRNSNRTNSTEIALWTAPGPFPRRMAAKVLGDALKATSIVRVIAASGPARTVKKVEVLRGRGCWEEELCGIRYKVSAPSFFQVNTPQAELLVRKALDGLRVGERSRVADLYCGVGTFTLPLELEAGDVVAVESAGSSVRDLRRNAEENGAWVRVVGGDSARELPRLGRIDALLVDPPRSGLADGVAESIAESGAARVAYISCNPATWARDVGRLEACGFRLAAADPVDLFPNSYHCEIASIFERL